MHRAYKACLRGQLSANISRQTPDFLAGCVGRYRFLVPLPMKRKHQRTPELNFSRPTAANVQWRDTEALFRELGSGVSEREGSRVAVVLFGEVRVFHRPHPSPNTDKGAVASARKWLEQHGVEP